VTEKRRDEGNLKVYEKKKGTIRDRRKDSGAPSSKARVAKLSRGRRRAQGEGNRKNTTPGDCFYSVY